MSIENTLQIQLKFWGESARPGRELHTLGRRKVGARTWKCSSRLSELREGTLTDKLRVGGVAHRVIPKGAGACRAFVVVHDTPKSFVKDVCLPFLFLLLSRNRHLH